MPVETARAFTIFCCRSDTSNARYAAVYSWEKISPYVFLLLHSFCWPCVRIRWGLWMSTGTNVPDLLKLLTNHQYIEQNHGGSGNDNFFIQTIHDERTDHALWQCFSRARGIFRLFFLRQFLVSLTHIWVCHLIEFCMIRRWRNSSCLIAASSCPCRTWRRTVHFSYKKRIDA